MAQRLPGKSCPSGPQCGHCSLWSGYRGISLSRGLPYVFSSATTGARAKPGAGTTTSPRSTTILPALAAFIR
eukprot:6823019-Heterocapsa_arctica.AAC.1